MFSVFENWVASMPYEPLIFLSLYGYYATILVVKPNKIVAGAS